MPPMPKLDLNANQESPPPLPAQLQKVLLNSRAISDEPYVTPVPNHVSVNHLYACSIRDGVMAISCTQRYRSKVIELIVYYDSIVQACLSYVDCVECLVIKILLVWSQIASEFFPVQFYK